jgi:hypothetical protein
MDENMPIEKPKLTPSEITARDLMTALNGFVKAYVSAEEIRRTCLKFGANYFFADAVAAAADWHARHPARFVIDNSSPTAKADE